MGYGISIVIHFHNTTDFYIRWPCSRLIRPHFRDAAAVSGYVKGCKTAHISQGIGVIVHFYQMIVFSITIRIMFQRFYLCKDLLIQVDAY